MIENGASVNHKDLCGETPLFYSVLNGHSDVTQYLIESGANVNEQSDQKATPLHLAVLNCRLSCISCLIKNGANTNIKDNLGKTPYELAKERKNETVLEYFDDKLRNYNETINNLQAQNESLKGEVISLTESKNQTELKLKNVYKELIDSQTQYKESKLLINELRQQLENVIQSNLNYEIKIKEFELEKEQHIKELLIEKENYYKLVNKIQSTKEENLLQTTTNLNTKDIVNNFKYSLGNIIVDLIK